ncbi:MAG: phosphoribosylglycinamide formyltransferase [Eubacteriales bacterium]|jgi:phosphoribosylglycinamide formyltransferase-1|nr:phosphoribosylglycinamide formyltransferase [Oscillospiraceae bacterium]MBQ1246929.1 phosphoribosylglycinamide formyltransferase [Clostridiales bacterium]MDO4420578.1 phosphoribosylglycinamide formyltransferase [Eubacteriales bacterium]MBQ1294579.1 phosphoribosylglycinamide formyltransferase [Clostridiales bacterium]MBQ1574956.1 phosphoribosylglycinamide formyltransferase [Clostridiales bacterium]
MKIAVFVSGGGTNLQAIIDNTKDGILKDIEISLVLSSSKTAYALERAADNGIKSAVVSKKDFDSIESWDDAVLAAVEDSGAELIVLAGYLSLMGPKVVAKYSNRIINIHPALIPSFCGAGMYGIRPHQAALAKGVKVSGATVHFVNENYDEGPILLQKAIDVLPNDTPETLQKRIMQECEWKILPEAIRLIADGRVMIENNIARVI